jgi:hypothetical protein
MKRFILFTLMVAPCAVQASVTKKLLTVVFWGGAASFGNDVYQTWDIQRPQEDYATIEQANLALALKRWVNLQTPKEVLNVVTLDLLKEMSLFTIHSARQYGESMGVIVKNASKGAQARRRLKEELAAELEQVAQREVKQSKLLIKNKSDDES